MPLTKKARNPLSKDKKEVTMETELQPVSRHLSTQQQQTSEWHGHLLKSGGEEGERGRKGGETKHTLVA